jgi:hypothetical protein
MTRRKRVLVIHYFFPPLGGAGVPRILKFVKYLPDLGWEVAVVTSSTGARWYGARDPSLLAEIPPSVEIIRAGELPVARTRRRLWGILQRLRILPLASYIAWPDETVGWLPFATAAALRAARRWHPDVLLSSSYPYTSHLVALAVSRSTGVPWVADFRDPWTRNPQQEPPPWPLPGLNARLERALVNRADRVVRAYGPLELVGLAPDDPRGVIINNGVDEADFDGADGADGARPPADRFRLTYVGSLYGSRDARPVFEAVARLVRAGVIDPTRFEVSLVGNVWLGDQAVDLRSVRVDHVGYVDHARAVREMRSATALLFYAPAITLAPSGKIFEYLVAGRPILSVARRDNLAFGLVAESGGGAAAEPDDPAGIERAITELYQRWSAGTLEIGREVRERTLARFSRRHLTQELAGVLDAVSDSRAPNEANEMR